MNPLSPRYAALFASNVYEAQDMNSEALSDHAAISGLSNLFDVPSAKISASTSGAIIRKRTGFAYAANGVGGRQGEVLLVFRGTDIFADWVTDANAGLQRGPSTWPVHAGFHETFKPLRSDIEAFLRGRNPSTVHCVGHTLGGALATLAADHLSELGVGGIKLYTFVSPRVGVSGFARHLSNKLGTENIYRVYHGADPVSMAPIFPFNHVPVDGNVCMLPWNGSLLNCDAHKMKHYTKSIGDSAWAGL